MRLTLSSIVGRLTMHWSGAERRLFRRIIPVVQERLRDVNNECEKPVSTSHWSVKGPLDPDTYQLDCIQFMIDSSKKMSKPSALYVYQQTLGLLLAGSQQAPMASSHSPLEIKFGAYIEHTIDDYVHAVQHVQVHRLLRTSPQRSRGGFG